MYAALRVPGGPSCSWCPGFRVQVAELRRQALYRTVTTFSVVGIPLLVLLFTFGLYVLVGEPLTPEIAFPAVSLLNLLINPLTYLPIMVANFINIVVALGRLNAFLQVLRLRAGPSRLRALLVGFLLGVRCRSGRFAAGVCELVPRN